MGDSAKKILFVNAEMYPYLPETRISKVCRELPQGIQERKKEIRAFMPRYGCINERKNQLHEVIRLSGMNIIISDVDRPLVIKVASISAARIQVYFIDNEDYFRRKQIDRDVRWAPDIIHCSGWISHVLPLYLKKAYKDDPIFSNSKVVLSLYDDVAREKLSPGFAQTILYGAIGPEDVSALSENSDGMELAKLAAQYSDGIILGAPNVDQALVEHVNTLGLPVLPCEEAALADGSYMDTYNAFYDNLLA